MAHVHQWHLDWISLRASQHGVAGKLVVSRHGEWQRHYQSHAECRRFHRCVFTRYSFGTAFSSASNDPRRALHALRPCIHTSASSPAALSAPECKSTTRPTTYGWPAIQASRTSLVRRCFYVVRFTWHVL